MLNNASPYPVAAVVAGDFDGDGVTDFAFVTQFSVTVWSSNGQGGFAPGPSSPSPFVGPFILVGGDFNGDGKLDIAVASFGGSSITVLLGDGQGSFSTAPGSPFNVNPITGMTPADFNGDGNLDLAVSFPSSNAATVLLGNGAGGFAPIAGGPFATGTQPTAIASGNFNSDGKPDMVTANFGTHDITLLLNTLPGLTANPAALQFYAAVGLTAPAGITANVTPQPGPAASYTVTPNQSWLSASPSSGSTTGTSNVTVAANSSALAAGNYAGTLRFNAPGYFGSATSVRLRVANPSGSLVPAPGSPFGASQQTYTATAIGDFNNDGNSDIVVVTQATNSAAVFLGDGRGGFTMAPGSPFPAGIQPDAVTVGDFNHDGNLDIAIANYTDPGTVIVLLGDGKGGFTAVRGSPFQTGYSPLSISTADFNHDGNLDLAVGTGNPSSGSLTVLLGNGAGGFTPASGNPFPRGTAPTSLVAADFNGDGIPDVATADYAGNVNIFLGNGAGGFVQAAGSPYPVGVATSSLIAGRVGEKATRVARPVLPSSNRRCRFTTSGSPESSRLRHAQSPIDGSAPTAPSAAAIVLLADNGMAAGCGVANAG